jgi:hypothetical protein
MEVTSRPCSKHGNQVFSLLWFSPVVGWKLPAFFLANVLIITLASSKYKFLQNHRQNIQELIENHFGSKGIKVKEL